MALVHAQVNGAGSPQSGAADCSALCPNAKDVMCRIRNKCWRSLLSMSAGLIGLLAAGEALVLRQQPPALQLCPHGWSLHA